MDAKVTVEDLMQMVKKFTEDRDWVQFHTPKNWSMDLAAETAELMEFFLWVSSKDSVQELEKRREEVEHELSDILYAILGLCRENSIDLSAAMKKKMAITAKKYPV